MYRIHRMNENLNSPFISFIYKGEKITIEGETPTKVYNSFLNWMDDQGYTFPLSIPNNKTRKVYNIGDLERMNLDYTKFHNINNKNLFIPNSSLFLGGNVELKLSNMIIMLKEFGVEPTTINSDGFKGKTKSDKIITNQEHMKKMTFVKAAQIILQENGNEPMTANEIWQIIDDRKMVETKGSTPWATLNAQMLSYSENSNLKRKYKNKIFTIVENNPIKFKLLNPKEIQNEEEFEEIPNVYCVRAGQSNRDANLFLEGNFVGINYDTKDFDISVKSKEEILQFLSSITDNRRSLQQFIQQIELFKEIQEGDIVLVPDSEGNNIGEVVSEMYLSDTDEYPNRFDVEWIGKIGKNKSVNLPKTVFVVKNFDTDSMDFNTDGSEVVDNEIEPFTAMFPPKFPKDFKAVQAQEEKEAKSFKLNPFRQAICVLGKSGKGKSTTVEKILDNYSEMEYDFIIPTASTTNLLSQYSPIANDYIQSRLGKLIMKAYKEPSKLFTAVFDECHKSNVIEMINDELLQCISLYRNKGNRFISLDDDTAKLYKGLKPHRGNLLIPDNVGFIFLSSKPDVIISNSDFFNRVDIYVLTKQPKDKEDISFEDTEYFTPVGNRENGSKSLEDIDTIKELNDVD